MAFRFQRRVKVLPGVRLNFSKSGVSTTVGKRGLSVTNGKRGTHLNVGLPGTGLAYRTKLDNATQSNNNTTSILTRSRGAVSKVLYIMAVVVILLIIGLTSSDTITGVGLFLMIGLVVIRYSSKAHKAKPFIKQAELLCRGYQLDEALELLKDAYAIYPNQSIALDIAELENYIENNNINNE